MHSLVFVIIPANTADIIGKDKRLLQGLLYKAEYAK
jgi:hypothetical protein